VITDSKFTTRNLHFHSKSFTQIQQVPDHSTSTVHRTAADTPEAVVTPALTAAPTSAEAATAVTTAERAVQHLKLQQLKQHLKL
jgi:predicted regulator of Ras-like GTPase activity (Roadblock/LC7/MglB family)